MLLVTQSLCLLLLQKLGSVLLLVKLDDLSLSFYLQADALISLNLVQWDATLARVTNPDIITSWQGDFSDGYDMLSRILPPKTGMLVKKFGRTTGLTRGIITTCAAGYMPLLYNADGFNALVYFSNFWSIQNYGNDLFVHPCDSSSLVVTKDAQAAVGLLFSVTKQGACMLPLIPVLNCFRRC